MCSDRPKNYDCGQKKPEGTRGSAIFGVGTAAKCCKLKCCADPFRSRTDYKDEVLEGKFRNLNLPPKRQLSILLNFFFPFKYRYLIFFSQVLNFTCVELKRFATQAQLLKKHLFIKSDFPPRKTPVAQKHHAISRQEKMAFSTPLGLSWNFPPPSPPDFVRAGGCTLTSQPKFLGSIGYQICLAMVLRWHAVRTGSALMDLFCGNCLQGAHLPISS